MEYDGSVDFPFDFEPIEIPFGSISKGKLSPRSYSIEFERKYIFVGASVVQTAGGAWLRLLHKQCCPDLSVKNHKFLTDKFLTYTQVYVKNLCINIVRRFFAVGHLAVRQFAEKMLVSVKLG